MAFSQSYIAEEKYFSRFHWLVFLFVARILTLIYSPNIISIILGWDGLGVTSFLLVAYFNSRKSFNASMLTALSNRVGDCLILITMAIIYSIISTNFFISASSITGYTGWGIMALICLAACTKRAQIPFSAWLPAAMAAPTPVSSLVHSSTLVTAGVYLIIRFNYMLMAPINKYIFLIGCFTITIASLSAFFERDIKKIIALSTLRQLGLIITAIGLNLASLAFFHLLTHAYFKAIIFITVGNLIHLNSSLQDFRLTSVNSSILGPTLSFIIVANLRLIGVPYMGGFYSKDLILDHCLILSLPSWELLVMLISVRLTAIYSFRFLILTLWRSLKFSSLAWANDNDTVVVKRISILWPLAIVGGRFLSWSIFPSPAFGVLPSLCKLLVLVLIITGIFIRIGVFNRAILSTNKLNCWGFGNLWSLPYISTFVLNFVSPSRLYMYKQIDNSWGFFIYLSQFIFKEIKILQNKRLYLLERLPILTLLILLIVLIY